MKWEIVWIVNLWEQKIRMDKYGVKKRKSMLIVIHNPLVMILKRSRCDENECKI
ncbi:MAG: hypothetical protein ACTSWR_07990 [Candidatus Helarchaeota archaeon]